MFWTTFLVVLWAGLVSAVPFNAGRPGASFSLATVRNSQYKRNGPAEYLRACRKWGVKLPDEYNRISKGSVAAYNQSEDREYLSPIEIGTPPQTTLIDLDTGSADLWLFTSETPPDGFAIDRKIYRPENSQTATKVPNVTWSIFYGDGSYAAGGVYRDRVAIGGLTLTNATVESATEVSESIATDVSMSGIMGLAINHSSTAWPKQPTVLDSLRASLAKNLFSADLRYHSPGQYDFGFVNESAFTGNLSWQKVLPDSDFWRFSLDGIHIGGTNVWLQHSWPMVADTGTTLMLLPPDLAAKYWEQVPSASNSYEYYGWVFPCDDNTTLPDFDFGFSNGFRGTVPGRYLNYDNVSEALCYGGIQEGPDEFSILGDAWLKTMYVVFDVDNAQVGLANKKIS